MNTGINKIVIHTNDLTAKALEISAKFYNNQVREGSDIPYIVYPVEVAMILQQFGASEEMIAASLLKGVFENIDNRQSDSVDLIEKSFGEKAHKIIEIINGISWTDNKDNIHWKVQKQQILDYLEKPDTPLDIKMVFCAQEVGNMRELVRRHREIGDNIWEKLNKRYDDQKWYYQSLVKSLESLEVYEMHKGFRFLVDALFKE